MVTTIADKLREVVVMDRRLVRTLMLCSCYFHLTLKERLALYRYYMKEVANEL